MEPAARKDQVETSLASNPRFGLQNLTAVLRVLEIIVGFIFFRLPVGVMTRAEAVEGGVLFTIE